MSCQDEPRVVESTGLFTKDKKVKPPKAKKPRKPCPESQGLGKPKDDGVWPGFGL